MYVIESGGIIRPAGQKWGYEQLNDVFRLYCSVCHCIGFRINVGFVNCLICLRNESTLSALEAAKVVFACQRHVGMDILVRR